MSFFFVYIRCKTLVNPFNNTAATLTEYRMPLGNVFSLASRSFSYRKTSQHFLLVFATDIELLFDSAPLFASMFVG